MGSSVTINFNLLLKFWFYFGAVPRYPDYYWPTPHLSLHLICFREFLINCRNHARSLIWLSNPNGPHKRSIRIFFLYLPSLISGNILHKICAQKSLKQGSNDHNHTHGHFLSRVRSTVGTNIILSSGCDH